VSSIVVSPQQPERPVVEADEGTMMLPRNEADDHAPVSAILVAETDVICEALVGALEGGGRVSIAQTARCPDEAAAAVCRARPDITLLQLPIAQGLIAARVIRAVDAEARLLAFGVSDDEREILAWAEAGVLGCLGRQVTLVVLVDAIEEVARGGAFCSSTIAATLFHHVAAVARYRVRGPEAASSPLTSREADVLLLVARGLANKEVAIALSVSVPTVKNHLHRIFQKLGIHRRADVCDWARVYESAEPAPG
jgi:two-component system nitrate/nitrite response regulator NarL